MWEHAIEELVKCHLPLFHCILTASLANRSFILLWIGFTLCILSAVMDIFFPSVSIRNLLESLMQISLTADATEAK